MRKSDLVIDALFLTVYQILSCIALYVVAWLFTKIANNFIEVGFFATNLIYTIITGVGMAVLLWLYAYKMTYRSAYFVLSEAIIISAISIVLHLLFAAIFNYSALIAGMSLPLSGIIVFGATFTAPESLELIPGLLPPLLFFAAMLFYHIGMILFKRLALNRRLIDRYELTGKL